MESILIHVMLKLISFFQKNFWNLISFISKLIEVSISVLISDYCLLSHNSDYRHIKSCFWTSSILYMLNFSIYQALLLLKRCTKYSCNHSGQIYSNPVFQIFSYYEWSISLLLHFCSCSFDQHLHKHFKIYGFSKTSSTSGMYREPECGFIYHGHQIYSTANSANSAWSSQISFNTAWPLGSNLIGAFLCQSFFLLQFALLTK